MNYAENRRQTLFKQKKVKLSMGTKRRKKLLVPFTISADIGSVAKKQKQVLKRRARGTKAFVKSGTKLKRGASPSDKGLALKRIGYSSPYFIKTLSPRAKRIISVLEKSGVRTEKPIEDLKNGTSLFESSGFGIWSTRGFNIFKRAPKRHLERIIDAFVKMHLAGVVHGHPHSGNIVITKKGHIVIIDLGWARISSKERVAKGKNAEGIARDVFQLSYYLAKLEERRLGLTKAQTRRKWVEISKELLNAYPEKMRAHIGGGFHRLEQKAVAQRKTR